VRKGGGIGPHLKEESLKRCTKEIEDKCNEDRMFKTEKIVNSVKCCLEAK
jgi:hypothetical protein